MNGFLFPSPTGVTYYELKNIYALEKEVFTFPSPTGVTYYEFLKLLILMKSKIIICFRPQQGLPIMNDGIDICGRIDAYNSFRPQQGLPIMNPYLQKTDKHY